MVPHHPRCGGRPERRVVGRTTINSCGFCRGAPKVKEELAASGFSGKGFALWRRSNGTYGRLFRNSSSLFARRRLARATPHGCSCFWRTAVLMVCQSPGSRKFCLASGGCKLEQTRPWLGLVDLSRIPSGTFFFGRSILARKWPAKMAEYFEYFELEN